MEHAGLPRYVLETAHVLNYWSHRVRHGNNSLSSDFPTVGAGTVGKKLVVTHCPWWVSYEHS